jgi:D-alanyl-D-alanine carboxypeptidase (penicillin-binding protein 5/6)
VSSPDAPPLSRRALRERVRAEASAQPPESPPADEETAHEDIETAPTSGRIALAWVDVDAIAGRTAPADLDAASRPYIPVLPDLVPRRTRRAGGVLAVLAVLLLLGGYTAATQLWPTSGLTPTVAPSDPPTVTAPASALTWPDQGVAAAGIDGVDAVASSSSDAVSMASITKLIAVLMVLDREPLKVGEQGPEREITYSDRVDYWATAGRGESALNVPVGGTLTLYQQLQGVLLASAGNYVDLITRDYWPTDESFATAARDWLDEHDLSGIRLVEATGIDRDDTADAASLVRLGQLAMADPVVAEIVGTTRAEIPGVGEIENTNPLLGANGVVGIKTGGLAGFYNLLAAADVEAGDTTVRIYAVVLGQPTEALRASSTQDVLDQLAGEATAPQTLASGTVVATATTAWGTRSDVVTTTDASVLLWNEATATAEPQIDLTEQRDAGDRVGSLTLAGPLDSATTDLALAGDLGEPDAWWRWTHPLELFGLTG